MTWSKQIPELVSHVAGRLPVPAPYDLDSVSEVTSWETVSSGSIG